MTVGSIGFIPERLDEAREARRIKTQKELAEVLDLAKSTISRWHNGEITPDPETLSKLAHTLGVRREFFLRPVYVSDSPIFHRALSTSGSLDLKYQKSQMRWLQELSHVLSHYVEFPVIDIPDVLNGASWKQLRDDDIEKIVVDLRNYWKLGEGPCGDVVSLLERIGVIVSTIEMGTAKLDGLCSWSPKGDRPHILLATDKMCFPRRQMDAAHELAHAVLHRSVSKDELADSLKDIEKQAFRFASAFLMPSTTYPYQVKAPSLANLLSLKEIWRVSVKAQIHRLSDLGMISRDHVVDLYKLHSARGWTKEEPLDRQWEVKHPRILRDAIDLIVSSGVRTKADLLSVEFTFSSADIERLAGLPAGWFNEKSGELVQLKNSHNRSNIDYDGLADIIPFKRKV